MQGGEGGGVGGTGAQPKDYEQCGRRPRERGPGHREGRAKKEKWGAGRKGERVCPRGCTQSPFRGCQVPFLTLSRGKRSPSIHQ